MKRCFIETVVKTGLFGATEYVLYRIPDNTDNRVPVYGTEGVKGKEGLTGQSQTSTHLRTQNVVRTQNIQKSIFGPPFFRILIKTYQYI